MNPIGFLLIPATVGSGNALPGPEHKGTFAIVAVDDIDRVGERSDQSGVDAVIFTMLHILNPSRRPIDALLVDIDEAPSVGAAPPARSAAQRSAHGSGPDWPPEDWD